MLKNAFCVWYWSVFTNPLCVLQAISICRLTNTTQSGDIRSSFPPNPTTLCPLFISVYNKQNLILFLFLFYLQRRFFNWRTKDNWCPTITTTTKKLSHFLVKNSILYVIDDATIYYRIYLKCASTKPPLVQNWLIE